MKTITTEEINSWNPCYPAEDRLPADWQGTVLDILDYQEIPPQDKLWVVCRDELLSPKLLRLFAVWCARQVQHLMKDQRSIAAIDVAERFANGLATKEELAAARDAACGAALEAAWEAAWEAAQDAAHDAAHDAAQDAAWDAQVKRLREMIVAGIETGDVK